MLVHLILWTLIAIQTIGTMACVAMIGKDRKPITAGTAVANVVLSGLLTAGIAYVAIRT